MKKFSILLLTAAAMIFSSCAGNTFRVEGTITETDMTNGAVVVMTDLFTDEADTAHIVAGNFSFSGPADKTTIKRVSLLTRYDIPNDNYCTFVPEKGVIKMNLDEPETMVFRGPVNTALSQYFAGVETARDNYIAAMTELGDYRTVEGGMDMAMEIVQTYNDDMAAWNDATFAENKDNAVALAILLLQQKIYEFDSVEELDKYLEGAASFIKEDKRVLIQRESLVALSKTAEGSMFVDFTGEDPAGNPRSLSDYVGKGKYVLVDFWASWCGPCRAEIPNIIKVYNTYAKKDLVVLGVPVWDERPDTDAAMAEMGIKYDQIYVGDDRTPTNLYGISGIPHIILFGPDGTIVKRNLRGATIEETIKSLL
ncbi:MAG: AhpC/TSA family protein [Bacteroidales bacterium]|nr:AhpC/TSA family protein [Bacteroidales bacterium]